MFAVDLLEEAGAGAGSIWIPVIVLGWFLLMTIIGWQVSRQNTAVRDAPQETHAAHSEENPSESDAH